MNKSNRKIPNSGFFWKEYITDEEDLYAYAVIVKYRVCKIYMFYLNERQFGIIK